jgi:hypothetical protein
MELDLDRLAYSVAIAETGDCTTGIGPRTNNCQGIMTWENGYREPRIFNSKQESYAAFKDLWQRKYGGFPTIEQAIKYTGNDHAETWLRIVNEHYQRQ